MKLFLIFVLGLALAACAQRQVALESELRSEASQLDFDRGMRFLEQEDFAAAAETFDRILVAHPASENDLVTVFNSGVAREGLGQCQKALDRYREVVRGSAGKFARLEGQALFRSSLMYECLGQDRKALTALLDAKKRAASLPIEIERAELPARLAAAYSRLGNQAKALEYFNMATGGLKVILASSQASRKQKETLARTLYFMGRLNPSQRLAEVEPIAFLQSLSMQQPYLLHSVEMGNANWSQRAQQDLTTAYENILRFTIQDRQKRQTFYVRALQVIAELRKIRLPDAGPMEDAVFAQVDKTARQLQVFMADAAESTRLTPEAEKRHALRREGRVIDPKRPAAVKRLKK